MNQIVWLVSVAESPQNLVNGNGSIVLRVLRSSVLFQNADLLRRQAVEFADEGIDLGIGCVDLPEAVLVFFHGDRFRSSDFLNLLQIVFTKWLSMEISLGKSGVPRDNGYAKHPCPGETRKR